MRLLSDCRLYAILDLGYVETARAEPVTARLIDGGVDIMQLRAKGRSVPEISELARKLHAITERAEVPLIINDHAEIAEFVAVEGVHVGQDDVSVAEARRIARRKCWIGKSTHSFDQALAAAKEGADYIGFGPLFPTPTKPDYAPIGVADIARLHQRVEVPVFCIGGIKLDNLPDVVHAGARRVVIVSGLLQAEDAANYARAAKQLLPPV